MELFHEIPIETKTDDLIMKLIHLINLQLFASGKKEMKLILTGGNINEISKKEEIS